jgi:hypothetical protein
MFDLLDSATLPVGTDSTACAPVTEVCGHHERASGVGCRPDQREHGPHQLDAVAVGVVAQPNLPVTVADDRRPTLGLTGLHRDGREIG